MKPDSASVVPELSVVMPCYNEAGGIEDLLKEWSSLLSETVESFEIIVINDGSTDGTGRVLDRLRRDSKHLRVIHQLNVGHGRAIRRGYGMARGRYVLQLDSSGCYEAADFLPLWEKRQYHPLVLGVRTHRLDGWIDRGFSKLLNRLGQWLYGSRLRDIDISFRLFHLETAKCYLERIERRSSAINPLLSVLWFRDYPDQICEVPVPYRARPVRLQVREKRHSATQKISLGFHYLQQLWRHRATDPLSSAPVPFPAR